MPIRFPSSLENEDMLELEKKLIEKNIHLSVFKCYTTARSRYLNIFIKKKIEKKLSERFNNASKPLNNYKENVEFSFFNSQKSHQKYHKFIKKQTDLTSCEVITTLTDEKGIQWLVESKRDFILQRENGK